MSLPKLLKKQKPGIECRMVIPTSSKTWRQDGVCIQYGFDKLYSRKEYTLSNYKENWLNDKLLFEYAASIDKNSKQPFSHLSSHHQRILHIPKQLKTTSFHSLTHIQKN